MADADHTPSNLFHLAAATSAIAETGDADWDTAFATWLRLDALQRADLAFGNSAKDDVAYFHFRAGLEEKFGPLWRSIPEAMALSRERFEITRQVDCDRSERFVEPMWAASIALALTPAPTLAAALFKIELIKREELDNDKSMPREPMDVVIEDMARLAGET